MSNLDNMSIEELEQLKKDRYTEAQKAGTLTQIAEVARRLGADPVSIDKPGYCSRYGPKHKFFADYWEDMPGGTEMQVVEVYVDDYGHYMTVHVNGHKMCSTHPCSRFFIPGPWVDAVLEHFDKAQAKRRESDQRYAEQQRVELLAQLQVA